MQVSLVPLEYIETVWPQIEEYMDGAARYTYGRFNVEDIKVGLFTKPQQLWIAFDEDNFIKGAVVTQVLTYPRMNALVMHFTGGIDLKEWKPMMLEIIQRFAKENGCDVIESYGREGWGKVFQNDGFKSRFMFYELPVEK
jgi:hypothetical protein